MDEREALGIFREMGAIVTDSHVVLTSGRHSDGYFNKDAVYPSTMRTAKLCQAIADHFRDTDIDVVAGPTVGGIMLAQWVAHSLCTDEKEVLAVFAEKEGEGRAFKRGYDRQIPGKRVLVAEDVLTTGGSAREVVEAIRALGGKVVGVGVLCNRGQVTQEHLGGVPDLFALSNIKMDSFFGKDCPFCEEGVPINTEVGKGREYLALKAR